MKFDYSSTSIFIFRDNKNGEHYDDPYDIDVDRVLISVRLVKPSDDYNIVRIAVLLVKDGKYSFKISFDEIFEKSIANKLLSKKSAIRLIKKQLLKEHTTILVSRNTITILDVKNGRNYEFSL
jgi:hypothetical protein